MKMRWSYLALGVLALEAVLLYPNLPDRVVSHWGAQGPDGWMPKQVFVPLMVGTAALMQLFVVGLGSLPLPARYVNLPNRGYWLAPERAEKTWRRVGRYADATLALVHALLALVLHISALMSGAPVLIDLPLPVAEALFLALIAVCCLGLPAWLLWSFRLPERERTRRARERRASKERG